MAQIDIQAQLKAKFAQPLAPTAVRRIVVWNDPSGEFEGSFDSLVENGFDDAGATDGVMPAREGFARAVRFVKAYDGVMFETKRLIARGDTENDLLVYRQRARGDIEGDWLADVELYADHFQADFLSILADELNAADASDVRAALSAYRSFFAAKTRRRQFSKCCPAPQTGAQVELGVLAALLGGEAPDDARASFVVRGYLAALQRDGAQAAELFVKYDAAEALERCVKRLTGFDGALDGRDSFVALASHVLLSAASISIARDQLSGLESHISEANATFCMALVSDWDRDPRFSSEALFEMCRLVENECGLAARFSCAPLDAIVECDVFPCVNEAILASLLTSFAEGADRVCDARKALCRRANLSWYARVACYFEVLAAVAGMREFKTRHAQGFHVALPAEVWNAYVGDWCDMDALYRSLCRAYGACREKGYETLEEPVRSALEWAENLYSGWFLAESNACWTNAAQAQWLDSGCIPGIDRQRDFFWKIMPACKGSAKTMVVIVSDALRFEVGREIADELEREKGGMVKLDSMQATYPSITEFGMAALLPHRGMSLDGETGAVCVDGLPSATTEQREAVLRTASPHARTLRAEKYLDMPAAERKELLKSAEVVYLYHNVIDATGEKLATESSVFDACDDAVRDLVALARRVCIDAPGVHVAITADHGFLYTRHELGECERISKAYVPDNQAICGKRHIVCRDIDPAAIGGDPEGALFIGMNMDNIEGGKYYGFTPRQSVRIKQQGGTCRYVHGGVSLQELCVPLITFWRVGSRSKEFEDTRPATLRVLSDVRRITNSLFGVNFLQEEPAVGKVLPCEYELSFADSSGNEVSDVVKAHADKTSPNPQDRVVQVRFALKGSSFSSKEQYFLVARERETGRIVWKEPYTIEVSFAPSDMFGF